MDVERWLEQTKAMASLTSDATDEGAAVSDPRKLQKQLQEGYDTLVTSQYAKLSKAQRKAVFERVISLCYVLCHFSPEIADKVGGIPLQRLEKVSISAKDFDVPLDMTVHDYMCDVGLFSDKDSPVDSSYTVPVTSNLLPFVVIGCLGNVLSLIEICRKMGIINTPDCIGTLDFDEIRGIEWLSDWLGVSIQPKLALNGFWRCGGFTEIYCGKVCPIPMFRVAFLVGQQICALKPTQQLSVTKALLKSTTFGVGGLVNQSGMLAYNYMSGVRQVMNWWLYRNLKAGKLTFTMATVTRHLRAESPYIYRYCEFADQYQMYAVGLQRLPLEYTVNGDTVGGVLLPQGKEEEARLEQTLQGYLEQCGVPMAMSFLLLTPAKQWESLQYTDSLLQHIIFMTAEYHMVLTTLLCRTQGVISLMSKQAWAWRVTCDYIKSFYTFNDWQGLKLFDAVAAANTRTIAVQNLSITDKGLHDRWLKTLPDAFEICKECIPSNPQAVEELIKGHKLCIQTLYRFAQFYTIVKCHVASNDKLLNMTTKVFRTKLSADIADFLAVFKELFDNLGVDYTYDESWALRVGISCKLLYRHICKKDDSFLSRRLNVFQHEFMQECMEFPVQLLKVQQEVNVRILEEYAKQDQLSVLLLNAESDKHHSQKVAKAEKEKAAGAVAKQKEAETKSSVLSIEKKRLEKVNADLQSKVSTLEKKPKVTPEEVVSLRSEVARLQRIIECKETKISKLRGIITERLPDEVEEVEKTVAVSYEEKVEYIRGKKVMYVSGMPVQGLAEELGLTFCLTPKGSNPSQVLTVDMSCYDLVCINTMHIGHKYVTKINNEMGSKENRILTTKSNVALVCDIIYDELKKREVVYA